MNKGIGKYVTLESKLMTYDDDDSREQMIKYLADELKDIFGSEEHKKTLVIGLRKLEYNIRCTRPKICFKNSCNSSYF